MLETASVIHGYVTLHQVHTRHFRDTEYVYDVAKVIVARVEKSGGGFEVVETVGGEFGCKQTCTVEVNLTPGRYLIYTQINSVSKHLPKSNVFTLSFYTSSSLFDLYDTDHLDPDPLLINYLLNH